MNLSVTVKNITLTPPCPQPADWTVKEQKNDKVIFLLSPTVRLYSYVTQHSQPDDTTLLQ